MMKNSLSTSLVMSLLLVVLQGTPIAAQTNSQPQADPASSSNKNYKGTLTDLTAGSGIVLTPNPITTSGVIAIDPSVIPQLNTPNEGNMIINGNLTVGSPAANSFAPAGFTIQAVTSGNLEVTGELKVGTNIGGGLAVTATAGTPNVIGGHSGNAAATDVEGATIGGGGSAATCGGPADCPNSVLADFGVVGGGLGNTAGNNDGTGLYATVGGGFINWAPGESSTVGGGIQNATYAKYATIAGGSSNSIYAPGTGSGQGASIGGGILNEATGYLATIPGGGGNLAKGDFSFAAGLKAHALFNGSFVWGGASTEIANDTHAPELTDTAQNQFLVRATGGVTIYTGYNQFTHTYPSGVTLATGSNAWSTLSDRNAKEHFSLVDGHELLDKLNSVSMETWNYKSQDRTIRHMGPMAQDFRAAFGLGEDETRISTVDADGVALAGVQALYRLLLQKDEEVRALKTELEQLRSEVRRPK